MRHLFILSFFVFAVSTASVLAEDRSPVEAKSFIRQHNLGACSFWTSIQGANYQSAYGCSSYPMSVSVPDAYDVNSVVTALENKIAELERRVQALEHPQP